MKKSEERKMIIEDEILGLPFTVWRVKITFIICIFLFLSSGIQAQISWVSDFEAAKALAKKTNRLIVMDFWASWCAPCLKMDTEVWNSPELQRVSKNFIGLRINVDYDIGIPPLYSVTVIPKVVIITSTGETIWERDSYTNAGEYLPVFTAIPANIGELNLRSPSPMEKKKDMQKYYSAGIEFQRFAITIKSNELKNSVLSCSGKYFVVAKNLCKDPVQNEEIILYSILNDVYLGRYQKAFKQIEKMDPEPKNENSAQLRYFILAKYYKNAGDKDNFQKEKLKISNKDFIAQLED